MRCHDLATLLDLVDIDRRPDPAAIAEHLDRCADCADRYAEIRPLVAPRALPRPLARAPGRSALLAAAALVVAAISLSLSSDPANPSDAARTDHETPRVIAAGSIRLLPSSASRIDRVTRTFTRSPTGGSITSRSERRVGPPGASDLSLR